MHRGITGVEQPTRRGGTNDVALGHGVACVDRSSISYGLQTFRKLMQLGPQHRNEPCHPGVLSLQDLDTGAQGFLFFGG